VLGRAIPAIAGVALLSVATPSAGVAADYPFPERHGIQITRLLLPDAHHPRVRAFGTIVSGQGKVALLVERVVDPVRGGVTREDTTARLSPGQRFVLRSRPFACGEHHKKTIIWVEPNKYSADGVATFRVSRSC
jgi:hypothetical protein